MTQAVKGYIQRKTMLYKTEVEYGNYTMNHVLGCAHGCNYPCYAFLMKRRFGQVHEYKEWIQPRLVENTLELLDKELPKLKDKIQSVHLCFTTDPFMFGYPEIAEMSIKAIRKINDFGIKCTVLTKGTLPIELADLSKKNEYGISVVTLDRDYWKKMEPNTAWIEDRIESLRALKEKGSKTWISIEPYPTPNIIDQDLNRILESVKFADKIIFGRMNYNKNVSRYKNHKQFYNDAAKSVQDFCQANNIDCYVKEKTIT